MAEEEEVESLTAAEISKWYRETAPKYDQLGSLVEATLSSLIKAKKVDHLSISKRTKAVDSLLEKFSRKHYSDLSSVTDMAGIRIITYIEDDIAAISELINDAFNVHPDKSGDKLKDLNHDQFGYRSVHFVCDLGRTRERLPECIPLKGLLFEIQIRTVLQHAWAEIEHDRSYKFSATLPSAIRRRLSALAGMLELADREFSALANEVDKYGKGIKAAVDAGKSLYQEEITSVSVQTFLSIYQPLVNDFPLFAAPSDVFDQAVSELRSFGVLTIDGLAKLITTELLQAIPVNDMPNEASLIRLAMIFQDPERYFASAWQGDWTIIPHEMESVLLTKFNADHLNTIKEAYGLSSLRRHRSVMKK